jgi:tetratricopeptide (TPR) repeat protein
MIRKRFRIALLALVMLVGPWLAGATPEAAPGEISPERLREAVAFCREGDKALGARDLAGARRQFRKALAAVRDFPDAHVGLGHAALAETNFEAALAEYRLAEESWRHLGQVLFQYRMERFEAAQRERVERRDDFINPQRVPHMPHSSDEAHVAAIERNLADLDKVERPTPERSSEPPPAVVFFQANALFHLGRVAEAYDLWSAVARRAPDFGPVHNNLAVAAWRLGRLDEARAHLERAEKLGVHVDPQFKAGLGR